MADDRMHPLVALMRRYVVEYTNSHDQTIYPEIFVPDYRVHINGVELQLDESYGPATTRLFESAPGLGLVVHELVLNGDRLCMRFSEHASMPRPDGGRALTCWRGIGLYRWDGERFTENHVEQDFLGRRRQIRTGEPDVLEPPHIDPWMSTQPVGPDLDAEAIAREFLALGRLDQADRVQLDDVASTGPGTGTYLVVEPERMVVNDLFSAGRRVAAHVTFTGPYRGGVTDVPAAAVGTSVSLSVAALVTVADDGHIEDVHAVSTRDVVRARLRTA